MKIVGKDLPRTSTNIAAIKRFRYEKNRGRLSSSAIYPMELMCIRGPIPVTTRHITADNLSKYNSKGRLIPPNESHELNVTPNEPTVGRSVQSDPTQIKETITAAEAITPEIFWLDIPKM